MLTAADKKALKRKFGDEFRDFTDEEWRKFEELLQQGSKWPSKRPNDDLLKSRPLGVILVAITKMKQWETDLGFPPASNLRDDAFRMLAVAANYYWKNRANQKPARDSRQQLEKLIRNYRRVREGLSKLAVGYAEELFLTAVIIDSLEKKRRDLQGAATLYESAAFHRGQLVFNLLLVWVAYGGSLGSSHQNGKVSGPLIRYLMFGCRLVIGRVSAPATLRVDIKNFKKLHSKMWNPTLRRPSVRKAQPS